MKEIDFNVADIYVEHSKLLHTNEKVVLHSMPRIIVVVKPGYVIPLRHGCLHSPCIPITVFMPFPYWEAES